MCTGRLRVAVRTGRVRRRPSTACTSLLVMHRDPFDVGLSAARESGGVTHVTPSNRCGGRPAFRTVLTLNTLLCESRTRLARQARRKPTAVADVLPVCGRWRGVAVSSQPCSL